MTIFGTGSKIAARSKVIGIIVTLVCCCCWLQADKINLLEEQLERELGKVAAQLDGVVGIAIMDLTSGRTWLCHEQELFPQASTIKIAILVEVLQQCESGKLKLDEPIELKPNQKVGGSGVLHLLTTPQLTLSLRDLCVLMVSLSDNTATNLLIDRVGMESVNSRMAAMGLKNTKLQRKMMDLQAAQEGRENISTPYDMLQLLHQIYSGKAMASHFRDELVNILSVYKESVLRQNIPEAVTVANKPGELEGVRTDCGIVYLKGRPFIICVMTTYLHDDRQGDAAIATITKLAFAHFSRIAGASEYGRVISTR